MKPEAGFTTELTTGELAGFRIEYNRFDYDNRDSLGLEIVEGDRRTRFLFQRNPDTGCWLVMLPATKEGIDATA